MGADRITESMMAFAVSAALTARPAYLPPSAWIEHLPFAFWLIDQVKPRLLVELGTHNGASYCGFCQAVVESRSPTQCFAVDTWKGDEHAGFYGEEVYRTLAAYHDPTYSAFSHLLRKEFDSAADDFPDGSIDILHIDGLHTYEAVRHDFETWLPKMSRSGIVLFHDTVCRDPGFGVWKFWREVESVYPSFEFRHGSGLGVLMTGPERPIALAPLLDDLHEREAVIRLFQALGRGISDRNSKEHFERLVVIREQEIIGHLAKAEEMESILTGKEASIELLESSARREEAEAQAARDALAEQVQMGEAEQSRLARIIEGLESSIARERTNYALLERQAEADRLLREELATTNTRLSESLNAALKEQALVRGAAVKELRSRTLGSANALRTIAKLTIELSAARDHADRRNQERLEQVDELHRTLDERNAQIERLSGQIADLRRRVVLRYFFRP